MKRTGPVLLLTFIVSALGMSAQDASDDEDVQPTGTITGRVFCQDTQLPARFAVAVIIPIPVTDLTGKPTVPEITGRAEAKTDLEGKYTLANVPIGDYFVVAEMQGYVSPVWQFMEGDLEKQTAATTKKLGALLPAVHVEAGKTSHADLALERGASMSGTVTYDDGAPGIGVYVRVVEAPEPSPTARGRTLTQGLMPKPLQKTDDRGRYRIDGLPAGNYLVEATLPAGLMGRNPMLHHYDRDPYMNYLQTGTSQIYGDSSLRKKGATRHHLTQGEDFTGADIRIPLTNLYSVSGTIVTQPDQPPVTYGVVEIKDAEDKNQDLSNAVIEDGVFHFLYLPSGKYELDTDVLWDRLPPYAGGPAGGTRYPYPRASLTIQVMDKDLSGIVLTIPEKAKQNSSTGTRPVQ